MTDFPLYSRFPTDTTWLDYRYSIDISMANFQIGPLLILSFQTFIAKIITKSNHHHSLYSICKEEVALRQIFLENCYSVKQTPT